MSECRHCGSKLPSFTFGELSYLCRNCRRQREEQRKRFAATNGYDFFTETLGPYKATTGLLVANLIVFAGMVYAGVDLFEPATQELIARGADYGPKTIGEHQYWRLITSAFVHIGLMHIALNAICLWSLGKRLEQFFGALTTIGVYLLTAVGASVLSLSWNPFRVSAGASGAIFGIAGALVTFLYYGKHDLTSHERSAELANIVRFSLMNLLLGLRANIDNMAHLGGLVTGLIIGWSLSRRSREEQRLVPTFQVAGIAAALLAITLTVGHAKEPEMAFMVSEEAAARGDFKKAIQNLKVYVAKYPDRANAHGLLGYCYDSDKQDDAAIVEYQAALKLDPTLAYVQVNLGHLYVAKKRFSEAIPLLEETLKHVGSDDDDVSGTYIDYATALMALGRSEEAEAAVRKALDDDGNNVELHTSLGMALSAEGKLQEAQREFETAKKLHDQKTDNPDKKAADAKAKQS